MGGEAPVLEYQRAERRKRSPSAGFVALMGWLVLGLAMTDVKMSPGGVFISIRAEVIPLVVGWWVVGTSCWTWQRRDAGERVMLGLGVVFTVMGWLLAGGMFFTFWFEPRVRSALVGW